MVYFIRAAGTDYVKVGSAKDPWIRLKGFQVGCPLKLELECVLPGSRSVENYFHQRLKSRSVHGEWFRLSQREVAPILDLVPSRVDVACLCEASSREERRVCEAWTAEADEVEVSRRAWQVMAPLFENSDDPVL